MQSEGNFPEEDRGRRPPPSISSSCSAWFFLLRSPFFAETKLSFRNDLLHFDCWPSFNSDRSARQIFNQTPRSSQSRSRRQHAEGCGNFSSRSCQRAPLR